mmetsp:Transcript_16279/g.53011  ORF Transcript_16279/g.53011 Transcript_16279/m.53011 type:complete len:269 (+) Transcript_16279:275-1081(+)
MDALLFRSLSLSLGGEKWRESVVSRQSGDDSVLPGDVVAVEDEVLRFEELPEGRVAARSPEAAQRKEHDDDGDEALDEGQGDGDDGEGVHAEEPGPGALGRGEAPLPEGEALEDGVEDVGPGAGAPGAVPVAPDRVEPVLEEADGSPKGRLRLAADQSRHGVAERRVVHESRAFRRVRVVRPFGVALFPGALRVVLGEPPVPGEEEGVVPRQQLGALGGPALAGLGPPVEAEPSVEGRREAVLVPRPGILLFEKGLLLPLFFFSPERK